MGESEPEFEPLKLNRLLDPSPTINKNGPTGLPWGTWVLEPMHPAVIARSAMQAHVRKLFICLPYVALGYRIGNSGCK
jgi:hypothetical protein